MTTCSLPQYLTEDEVRLFALVRENPSLLESFLEMADIVGSTPAELETGDDAEEATLSAVRKTGHALLQTWAEKRAQSVEATYVPAADVRSHGKKKPSGEQP